VSRAPKRQSEIITGDALDVLRGIPSASVQCCVTSPPYWGLRDYQVECQFGLEKTPGEYVEKLVAIFREVRRVLRDDGTCWVNLGDSYAASSKGSGVRRSIQPTNPGSFYSVSFDLAECGLKPKDLVGIPWMSAIGLRTDGWYLRAEIIWAKDNPMPESVLDRPTREHEQIFLLSKSDTYFYDADAIREKVSASTIKRFGDTRRRRPNGQPTYEKIGGAEMCGVHPNGRNARSVWAIASQPFPEAHFATFPEEIPRRCILAGSHPGDVVLDPFCGSGTTCLVADAHQRRFIGIELNPEYAEMARRRVFREGAPLFTGVT